MLRLKQKYHLFWIAALILVVLLSVTMVQAQDGRTIKIGYVSPQTGSLAPFGEADQFVLDTVTKLLADGIDINGTKYPVQAVTIELDDTDEDTVIAPIKMMRRYLNTLS